MTVLVGVSGWRYRGWRGTFYPTDLPAKRELEYISRRMPTLEINGTFYSLQTPASFSRWYEQTPPGFVFAVKGGRFITHMKKLREIEVPLANFLASGVLLLKEKLGPILWQFPPGLPFDRARFEAFLELLPADLQSASRLARKHSSKLDSRSHTKAEADAPVRHAFEVRHQSFFCQEFMSLLASYGAALVFSDSAGTWPCTYDLTADFLYLRLHGDQELYASGYTPEALGVWASRIRSWQAGHRPAGTCLAAKARRIRARDTYVYFDNDAKVFAPFNAIDLARRLASRAGNTQHSPDAHPIP